MPSLPARRKAVDRPAPPAPPAGVSVVASGQAVGWEDCCCAIVEGRPNEPFRHRYPGHVIAFHLKGAALVELTRGGKFTRFYSEPGSFTVIPADIDCNVRIDRPVLVLCWSITARALHDLAKRERGSDGNEIEVAEALGRRDGEVWALGKRLADLLATPVEGSRVYAEAVSVQLAVQLLWCNAPPPGRKAAGESLDDGRLGKVVDYIEQGLGGEISVDELAEVSGFSPGYFVGAFKRALGKTPHQYLTERRVARACELLQDPHRAIIEVAMDVGFSSQSHLTSVFRKFMKTTPAAYRQQVLGLRQPG
jgi:AraC family transcriptional regulator